MVMIRCPNCGQRTLDVASACPKCGHVLLQNPLETHAWNDLVSCPRCGKHIERGAPVCGFCGHGVQRSRRARLTAVAVLGLVALAAGGFALIRATGRGAPGATPPIASAPPNTPAAAPDAGEAARPTAAPDRSAAPDTSSTGADVQPDPPPPSPAPARRPGQIALSLVTRWTVDWANVREARSVSSAVVRVLAPGREVAVADMRNGWWAVYENGTIRGYIANSVLAARPPGAGP